jgi:hypothetical protein
LSDYYVQTLSVSQESLQWNDSRVFYPIMFCIKNKFEAIKHIIDMTYKKDKQSGQRIKLLF